MGSAILLNNSVDSRIARGTRFESRSGYAPTATPTPVTLGGFLWVRGYSKEHQKLHVSFRADSETKLIKQGGGYVKDRPSGSVA